MPAFARIGVRTSGAIPSWGSGPPSICRNSSGDAVALTGRLSSDANQADAWRWTLSRRLGISSCVIGCDSLFERDRIDISKFWTIGYHRPIHCEELAVVAGMGQFGA